MCKYDLLANIVYTLSYPFAPKYRVILKVFFTKRNQIAKFDKFNIILENLYVACSILLYKMETANIPCSNTPYNTSIYK